MSIFTYTPDRNFTRSSNAQTYEAKFGDGYSQRTSFVLNNNKEEFRLSFKNRPNSEITNIMSFFETARGVDAFDWTPPGEATAIRVVATKWDKTYVTPDVSSVTATFVRVYE